MSVPRNSVGKKCKLYDSSILLYVTNVIAKFFNYQIYSEKNHSCQQYSGIQS